MRKFKLNSSSNINVPGDDVVAYIKQNTPYFQNDLDSIGEELDYLIDQYSADFSQCESDITVTTKGRNTVIFDVTVSPQEFSTEPTVKSTVSFTELPGEWMYDEEEDIHILNLYTGTIAEMIFNELKPQLKKSASSTVKKLTKHANYLRFVIMIKSYTRPNGTVYGRFDVKDMDLDVHTCLFTEDGTYIPVDHFDLSENSFYYFYDKYMELYGRPMQMDKSYYVYTDGRKGPIVEMIEKPYTDKYLALKYNWGNSMLN